jgi:hypothetical protein
MQIIEVMSVITDSQSLGSDDEPGRARKWHTSGQDVLGHSMEPCLLQTKTRVRGDAG